MNAKANLSRILLIVWVVVVAVALALLSVGQRTVEAQTTPTYYEVQNLGAFPGGINYEHYSVAEGMNDLGHLVGTSRIGPCSLGWGYCGYVDHAFLYRGGGMQNLGYLLGNDVSSYASAINNSGQVVGWADCCGGWCPPYAFLYEDGKMKNLGTLGGAYSEATDINESGQIVGASTNSSDEVHAFLYDSTDGMKDLGGAYSRANAINESGQIVGTSTNSSGERHAFLYDSTNGMKDLGTLGGAYSEASDINDSGQVVGSAYNSSGERHAFLYEDGEMKDIGSLGGAYSSASAINNSGQVVGSSDNRAFLYEDGEMIDLGTRLHPDNNGTVWNSMNPVAINNEGQIAATGWRQNVDTFEQCAECALLLSPTGDTPPPDDAEAPSPPTITSPLNDFYDTDGSISVSGNAEAGSIVELFEGATSKGTTKADPSSGAWSLALSGVSEGAHTYTTKATDASGNNSDASGPVTVIVDKSAPRTSATRSVVPNAVGWNNANLTVRLNATDNQGGSGVQQITYSASGAQSIAQTDSPGDSLEINLDQEGTTTLTYYASDKAGNVVDQKSLTLKIDKKAPNGSVTINAGASRTRSRSVTLTLGATDPSPGSGVSQMRIANTQSGLSSASWVAYATTRAWTLTSGQGTKTVYAQYRDGAGNRSANVTDTITFRP